MIPANTSLFLASGSPRRRKLLEMLNFRFTSFSVDVDESFDQLEKPEELVTRLSVKKLEAAKKDVKSGVILTADTIVVLNGKILGKPADEQDAFNMLMELSNNTHTVYTGYSMINLKNSKMISKVESTLVTFRQLKENEVWAYVKQGSPMDKAGSYGIQDDFGAVFVNKIEGCYYNVVGLPVSSVYGSLMEIISE